MKKGLFAFVFLFVCNLFTFGQMSLRDFQVPRRSPFYALSGGLLPILSFVVIVIVLLIVVSASKGKVGRNSTLILEEFSLNENEDDFLKIRGRASGFWNWILSLFDKAPTTFFTCNKHVLKYKAAGINYNIPLVDITCVSSGMLKSSIVLLVLGILFCIGIVTIPIGIILLIVYAINKKSIHFGIYIGENKPIVSIAMKRGIIGSIDINKFESAANALNKAVFANKT